MIAGRYEDSIISPECAGRVSPWRSNLIVASCYELVATLMGRRPGASGALWWAIGSGSSAPPPSQTQLDAEFHRQPVRPEHISFVNALGSPTSGASRIQIRTALRGDLLTAEPREFGLFGLDNTLAFFGSLGRDWPVHHIKGIGVQYTAYLQALHVETVDELARLDRLDAGVPVVESIPAARMRAFVEKALTIRRYRPLLEVESLSHLSVLEVLDAESASLVSASGGVLDSEGALDAQRSLRVLQVAIDTAILRQLRVGELFRP